MFSQPLQELYNNSLVIIISIITPMMIDSIKQYLHKDTLAHSKKESETKGINNDHVFIYNKRLTIIQNPNN